MLPGVCITPNEQCPNASSHQQQLHPYGSGCPSHYNWLIIAALMLYLAAFSPGMGPVPWAVNAEIYPVQVKAIFALASIFAMGSIFALSSSFALGAVLCMLAVTPQTDMPSLCSSTPASPLT